LLLDTIGELTALYGIADAVFVGGSLAPGGGHNPLEPAALGKAPVFGASMDNFRDVASAFLAADAAIEVHSGAELGAAWSALLADEPRRERMGRAARELVERHRGATQRALARIETVLVAGPAAVLAAEKARR
jgi:3-deoxy-D-manno-octulosonic-acid transferase